MKILIGLVESGKFKGRRILLGKKGEINKKAKEWWIEDGVFLNGAPKFVRACLKHDLLDIPMSGCPKCKEKHGKK